LYSLVAALIADRHGREGRHEEAAPAAMYWLAVKYCCLFELDQKELDQKMAAVVL
jgi:hypothetical protein